MLEKCMYKGVDGICARSTSVHHCQQVTDAICGGCVVHQTTPTVNDRTRFQRIMRQAADALKDNDAKEALRILDAGLRI